MITKTELFNLIEDTQVIYLATADGEGRPFVRPVTLITLDDRFWIATGTEDKKMSQISENNNFEFCLPIYTDDNGGYIRISGKISIVTSLKEKTKIHKEVDFIKMFWSDPADKGYGLLKLDPKHIEYMRPGEMEALHQEWSNLKK